MNPYVKWSTEKMIKELEERDCRDPFPAYFLIAVADRLRNLQKEKVLEVKP